MQDFMTTSILFGFINKIDTGNIILDAVYLLGLLLLMSLLSNDNFKNRLFDKYRNIARYFDNKSYITIKCEDTHLSTRFKAVMHYIGINSNQTITGVIENIQTRWSNKTNDYTEDRNITWKINQSTKFKITKDIYGIIYYYKKEKYSIDNNKMNYIDISELVISSSKFNTKYLTQWIEDTLDEYDKFIKGKILDKQYLVEVTYNKKSKDIDYMYTPWTSNVTFENRFFTNKDKIVENINFFINNKDWYKERGIPYTLGILLWGEPGCGKTGFIKSIMNMTKRHGINIKLNNKFDMNLLKDIIYDEELGTDLVIPQDKRIIIFEDIDCMSDITTDRDIKKQQKEDKQMKKKDKKDNDSDDEDEDDTNDDNNLSNLLNILDGLQECTGRIIIMTTNKPEMLDKALVRPGRIDYKLHFTKATINDITNILNHYWNIDYDGYKFTKDLETKFSHADIVNMCRSSNTLLDTINKLNL